jgi:hypothetical protein
LLVTFTLPNITVGPAHPHTHSRFEFFQVSSSSTVVSLSVVAFSFLLLVSLVTPQQHIFQIICWMSSLLSLYN